MMMETVVYSREYLFVKELYDKGELGRIQFLRGSHQQDMEGWPGYWEGLPPMHYATHCVSPCLAILGKHAEHVVCHGSGRIDEGVDPEVRQPVRDRDGDVQDQGFRRLRRGHPEPLQHRPPVSRELRRLRQQEELRVAAGRRRGARHPHQGLPEPEIPSRVPVPDFAQLLPEPIQRFTTKGVYDAEGRDPPLLHPGRRPRRLSPPFGSCLAQRDQEANALPCPTPRPRPTGPWSASAPTSRP